MVPYCTYTLILVLLIVLTGISVAVTQIELTKWSTLVALLLAGTKTSLVMAILIIEYLKALNE